MRRRRVCFRNNFEIRNPNIEDLLKGLAQDLHSDMPEGWCFALFICSIGEQGATFYVSDAERKGMVEIMQTWIDRQRKGE